jgi:hypothetical protein
LVAAKGDVLLYGAVRWLDEIHPLENLTMEDLAKRRGAENPLARADAKRKNPFRL